MTGTNLCSLWRSPLELGTCFPGDTPPQYASEQENFSDAGYTCRVSRIQYTLSSHAGTHADLPRHFIANPEHPYSDDQYSGPCVVLDVSGAMEGDRVRAEGIVHALAQLATPSPIYHNRILLKTRAHYDPHHQVSHCSYLGRDAAELLASMKLDLLGTDSLSVDEISEKDLEGNSHGILYRAGIALLESVHLTELSTCFGTLETIFDPLRACDDARGVAAIFFTKEG